MGEMTKVEIIRRLSDINGYRRYLEIVTPTTGVAYANVDRSRFETCHRLMYRCAESFDDGMPIDFRSADLDISSCIGEIKNRNLLYDVMLVDPWHEYETSLRDLREAFDLLRVGGSIVVHDCLPPEEQFITPNFIPGGWGGLTFKAYLDFVLTQNDLEYFTVDTDWGCGVIRKLEGQMPFKRGFDSSRTTIYGSVASDARPQGAGQNELLGNWKNIRGDHHLTIYRFVAENKRGLLKMLTTDEFLAGQRA